MTKATTNPKVDVYLGSLTKWRDEMENLRGIILDCGLSEELKWGKPCYASQGANVVILQGFRDYCAVLFFKGVLLTDPDSVLVKTGVNTHVGRQMRFTSVGEIVERKSVLRAFVSHAIDVERAGLNVARVERADLAVPEELQQRLDENPSLKAAFHALTPGRQRGYVFHFSAPKQSATRASRVERCVQRIFDGKGLNDR